MEPFRFKQFSVSHEKSAFKVGTDAVLLGSWVNSNSPARILDVGTGSGVIALMMAQRFLSAQVVAVELDKLSAEEAGLNFSQSPWSSRLTIVNQDFVSLKLDGQFDLIVSNPPFFSRSMLSGNHRKDRARHGESMSLSDLITGANELLTAIGALALVIPMDRLTDAESIANKIGLVVDEQLDIMPKPNSAANRVLVRMSRTGLDKTHSSLVIREGDNSYTEKYKEMSRAFYPAF